MEDFKNIVNEDGDVIASLTEHDDKTLAGIQQTFQSVEVLPVAPSSLQASQQTEGLLQAQLAQDQAEEQLQIEKHHLRQAQQKLYLAQQQVKQEQRDVQQAQQKLLQAQATVIAYRDSLL